MIQAVAIAAMCLGVLALLVLAPAYRSERERRIMAEIELADERLKCVRVKETQLVAKLNGLSGTSGLGRLLRAHPEAEVAWVENQHKDIVGARRADVAFAHIGTNPGPWTCVDLYENGKILRFAIWNRTDTVYELDEGGAVGEEPYL